MSDAWSLLIAHSSLTTGDAWDHLNNQVGGGAGVALYAANVETQIIDTDINIEYTNAVNVTAVQTSYNIDVEVST